MYNLTRYHVTQYRHPGRHTIDHGNQLRPRTRNPAGVNPTLAANSIGCTDPWQHENCQCLPRKGEMVRNGGFENPCNPLHNWTVNGGVDVIDPARGDIAHQGQAAAQLGLIRPQALLCQDIPGVCPGGYFQLTFFLCAAESRNNPPMRASLEFLDKNKQLLVAPAVDILIPACSLSTAYTAFINITRWPSPHRTHFARVRFTTDNSSRGCHTCLDDVSLAALARTTGIDWHPSGG